MSNTTLESSQDEVRQPEVKDDAELKAKADQAFHDGTLITLSIAGTGQWKRSVKRNELKDRGVELPENFHGGYRYILLKEAIQPMEKIEGQARKLLQQRALPFPIVGAAFIQDRHFDWVITRLTELEGQFWEAVDEFIDHYEEHIANFKSAFPADWEHSKDAYPDRGNLRGTFSWEMRPWKMRFPDMGEVDVEDRIKRGRIDAEYRDQLQQAIEAQKARARSQLDSFVQESLRQIRGRVVDDFREILSRKQSGKHDPKFNNKNLKKIREAIDYVREMDVIRDDGLENNLRRVEQILESHSDFRDDKQAENELRKVLGEVAQDVERDTEKTVGKISANQFSRQLDI